MSAERPGKSHRVAWALAVFVAAPAFYLLSVPIIIRAANLNVSVPDWLIYYSVPYGKLKEALKDTRFLDVLIGYENLVISAYP